MVCNMARNGIRDGNGGWRLAKGNMCEEMRVCAEAVIA